MHQASFELIEIPHVRQSGKNWADIRMVVDALDLCYTKSHVDTFVIVSGDFGLLAARLEAARERQDRDRHRGEEKALPTSSSPIATSSSTTTTGREQPKRQPAKKAEGKAATPAKEKEKERDDGGGSGKKQEAVDLVLETIDDMVDERGVEETLWGSMVKQAIKRRKPGFSESYYGYRSFNQLLEELQERGLVELERDDKSGGYTIRSVAPDE